MSCKAQSISFRPAQAPSEAPLSAAVSQAGPRRVTKKRKIQRDDAACAPCPHKSFMFGMCTNCGAQQAETSYLEENFQSRCVAERCAKV